LDTNIFDFSVKVRENAARRVSVSGGGGGKMKLGGGAGIVPHRS
jgi:hypothetical protein